MLHYTNELEVKRILTHWKHACSGHHEQVQHLGVGIHGIHTSGHLLWVLVVAGRSATVVPKFAWNLKQSQYTTTYIFVDVDALVTIRAIREEFAFLSWVKVRACPILDFRAVREVLALGLLLLLVTRGGTA